MNCATHQHRYHLFFSTFVSDKVKTQKEVLHKSWLLSEVYRRSLGMVAKKKKKKMVDVE
jgi:hypothetical protein